MRRTTLTLCFALMLVPLTALAQPGPAPTPSGYDVTGRWEGFSSIGEFLVIDIVGRPDGSFFGDTLLYQGDMSGTPVPMPTAFRVLPGSTPGRDRFETDTTGTLDAVWYGPDGLRLHFPDGMVVVMARVVRPDAASRPPPRAAPPGTIVTPVQVALLHVLSGTWTGRPVDDPIAAGTGVPMTFVFTVEDATRGLLVGEMSFESDRETEYLQVVGGSDQILLIAPRDSDEVATFKFVNEYELEVFFEGEPPIRLIRDPH